MLDSNIRTSILIIDSHKEEITEIQSILGEKFILYYSNNCTKGKDILVQHPEICILMMDITKNKKSGYKLINTIKSSENKYKISIIVITDIDDKSGQKHAVSLGVEDILTKPYNSILIKKIISNNLERISLLEEKGKGYYNDNKHIVEIDEKIGIYNRNTFYREVRKVLSTYPERKYVIVRWDIDRFKIFNDTYGILEGDKLLSELGKKIIKAKNNPEIKGLLVYGHLSADHFISLWDAEYLQIDKLSAYVKQKISEIIPYYNFSLSFGMYRIVDLNMDVAIMCDRALLALHSVKHNYHFHYAWFNDYMRQELIEEQEIIGDMHEALEKGQFVPYFQPQYNYENGALIGAEVLVRWNHPKSGLIYPDKFIPIFEKYGLIHSVDYYIWEKTCLLLQNWIQKGINIPHISVNISRRDLYLPNFSEILISLINKYNIPISMFHLEITESAYMENPNQLIDFVNELQKKGFHVEMDDFGNGYSSLNTLKDVAVDTLKLDTKFIANDETNKRGGSILSSIIRLANAIELPVIAEGVETKEQADYLKSIGCLFMQGYYFARPMTADNYEQLLIQGNCIEMLNENNKNLVDGAADFLNATTQSTLIFNSFVGGAGILEYTKDSVTALRLNDKFFDIYNTTREEYADRQFHFLDSFTNDTRQAFIDMLDTAIRTSNESSCEVCSVPINNDDKDIWTFNKVRCLAERFGSYIFFLSVENISERKHLEFHNKELNEQLTSIMASTQAGIVRYCLKQDKQYVDYVSTGFAQMVGYDANELPIMITKDIYVLVYKNDIERINTSVMNSILYGAPFDEQYRLVRQDGNVIWVSMKGNFTGIPGVKGFFYATYYDISKLKELEFNLSSEKSKMESIINSIPGGVLIISVKNDKFKLQYVSNGVSELVGRTPEEFETFFNSDPELGIFHNDCSKVLDAIHDSINTNKELDINFRALHVNNSIVWINMRGVKINSDNNTSTFSTVISNLSAATGLYQHIVNTTENSIFVADINTYELLLVNTSATKLAGGESKESFKGKKCYEYVKHLDHPCNYCKISELKDSSQNIEYGRYLNGKYYNNIISKINWNGRDVFIVNKADKTDSKKAQQQIDSILRYIPGGITIFKYKDGDITRTYLSKSAYKILGYNEGEIAAEDFDVMINRMDSNDIQGMREAIIKSVKDITSFNYDWRIIPHPGDIRWINLTANPYIMEDGLFYFGIYSDITDRKTSEEYNKNLSENLNDIIENSPSGVYRCFLGNPIYFDYVSETFCSMVGYSHDELLDLINLKHKYIIYEEDSKYVIDNFNMLATKPQNLILEYRLKHKNGKIIYVSNSARSIRIENGKMIAYCIITDVSLQKEKTELLRIRDEEYRLVIEQSNKTIYRYNIAKDTIEIPEKSAIQYHTPIFITNAAESMIKSGIIRENTEQSLRYLFAQINAGKSNVSAEICIHHKDNTNHWYHALSSSFNDISGKPVSALITFEDITEQHVNKIMQLVDHESLFTAVKHVYYFAFHVNLSKNNWYYFDTTKIFDFFIDNSLDNNYNLLVKKALSAIHPDDRIAFEDTFSSNNLLKKNSIGTEEIALEYRIIGPDNEYHWNKTTAVFISNTYDDDIRAVILSQIIDDQKKNEEKINHELIIASGKLSEQLQYGNLINSALHGMIDVFYCDEQNIAYRMGNLVHDLGYPQNNESIISINERNNFIYKQDYSSVINKINDNIHRKVEKYEIEYQVVKNDNNYAWVLEQGMMFTDKNGRKGYVVVYLDVSKNHSIIKKLTISEEETRFCIEKIGKMLCHIDVIEKTLVIPQLFAEQLGIPQIIKNIPEGIKQYNVFATKKDYSVRFINFIDSIFQGKTSGTVSTCFRYTDGSTHWYKAEFINYFNGNGKPVRAFFTNEEVTSLIEQQEENKQLKTNESFYNIIAEHSSRIFYYYNYVENFAYAFDNAICKSYGLKTIFKNLPEAAIDNNLIYPDSITSFRTFFDKIRNGSIREEIKVHIRCVDFKERWFNLRYTAIQNVDKNNSNAILSFLNITEQHSREVAYARYQQTLKERNINEYIFFETDLTSDIVENQSGKLLPDVVNLIGNSHTNSITYIMETFLPPTTREQCNILFSREHLLSMFAEGKCYIATDWQIIFKDSTLHWVRVSLQMVLDPYSNHVKVNFIVKDITEDKEKLLSVKEQAELDGMTQVLNRTTSEQMINNLLSKHKGESCVMLILDLDNLKDINDTLGHDQGDRALKTIAVEMKNYFRSTDIIGRLGGDEFIAFLPNMKNDVSLHISISTLIRKISEIIIGENNDKPISCSIGATIGEMGVDTFDSLYKQADIALYYVKRNGKNNYSFFEHDMQHSNFNKNNHYYSVSLKNNEMFDTKELRKFTSTLASFYPLIISANITKNTLYLMEYEYYFNSSLPKVSPIDVFLNTVALTIHPDYRTKFLSISTNNNLLYLFKCGKKSINYECKEIDDNGIYRWIRIIIMIYQNDSGDVCDFCLVRELTEKNN